MGQARFLEQDGPLELLQEILFHANSIQDAYSLSMTCKRMQDAWLSNNCGIRVAWAVVERAVPAAELALIAHRAAKDALERERTSAVTSNGSLDPREMSSRRCVPKPEEFKAVWTLHDLAMSLEARFRQTRYQKPDDRPWGSAPEQLHRMAEWRLGMHKAIYRSLITGAALASLYKAIFVAAMKRPELRLDETRLPDIPAEREAFLRNFSALRQPMTEAEEEEAFGIYGQWLLNELQGDQDVKLAMENAFSKDCGRARSCREREKHDGQSCPVQLTAGGSHHEAHSVALELMRLLWTCSEVIRGLLSGSAAGKAENVVGRYALIVPFGRFSAWMVARCSHQEGDCAPLHIGRPVRVGGEVDSLPWITSQLFDPAGQTQTDGRWAPPVAFNFFAYFLRKHMNLAFRNNFFRTVRILDTEDDWTSFTQSLFIFALDDVVGRETYYPLWASHNWLPRNGFLDGGDLLTSYESNNKH